MSLTGPVFLDGVIVLTIAAFVAVVVFWPRLTGRGPWRVAGRVGALALVNVLVLLTAATQLNATYLFFSDWSDLSGAMTGHLAQTTVQRGGSAQVGNVSLPGAAPVLKHPGPPPEPVSSTGLGTYTVHGVFSGLTGTVLVQLPPGYSTAPSTERYPVLEAFHGYPGVPLGWLRVFHVQQVVGQLVGAHELRQPLIVIPQIEFPAGVDTEGVNGPAGDPQVETWLTRDLPVWIGQHFRVIANRNAWATIGYSAGAYDAAMAPILHPAQYGAGIVLGGYFSPEFGAFYKPFSPTSPQGRRYDLSWTAAHHPPPVALWVETSKTDPVSYPSSSQFLKVARKPLAVHAVILNDAGHRVSVFTAELPSALTWLAQNVRGFRPAHAALFSAAPARTSQPTGAGRA